MSDFVIERIPYHTVVHDFAPFADEVGSVLLHSASHGNRQGRYSFWGVHPLTLFETKDGFITQNGHTTIGSSQEALQDLYQSIAQLPVDPYFPFQGGLIGFFGYEWGAQLENIKPREETAGDLPDAWFGLYDTIVGYDHFEKNCWIASYGLNSRYQPDKQLAAFHIARLKTQVMQARSRSHLSCDIQPNCNQPISNFSKTDYLQAIQKIKMYLQAGDCYQVNLTHQLQIPTAHSAWSVFNRLIACHPAPFAAFLQLGSHAILSASPELLLKADADGYLATMPIKGTRSCHQNQQQDELAKEHLWHSPKDQAELFMITDLERNDLGKVSLPGTVITKLLKAIKSFSHVHHLVSLIEGKRHPEKNIIDVMVAMLPGGSITGAPKVRAMQIIREMETLPRGVYTGAIGWMGPQNTAHFNIAIRTITLHNAVAHLSVGGGIVLDSDPEEEYRETWVKARGLLEALNVDLSKW